MTEDRLATLLEELVEEQVQTRALLREVLAELRGKKGRARKGSVGPKPVDPATVSDERLIDARKRLAKAGVFTR